MDIENAVSDIFNAVANADNNHVEVINRLDETNELLERIATATEQKLSNDQLQRQIMADQLRSIGAVRLAELLETGRVS